jgi:hypothetical protein
VETGHAGGLGPDARLALHCAAVLRDAGRTPRTWRGARAICRAPRAVLWLRRTTRLEKAGAELVHVHGSLAHLRRERCGASCEISSMWSRTSRCRAGCRTRSAAERCGSGRCREMERVERAIWQRVTS